MKFVSLEIFNVLSGIFCLVIFFLFSPLLTCYFNYLEVLAAI